MQACDGFEEGARASVSATRPGQSGVNAIDCDTIRHTLILFQEEPIERYQDVSPGVIIARQTFREGVCFHPHLHAIVTGDGWSEDCTWQTIFGWDRPVLRKLFEAEVFRFLRERELLSAERMELIRSWRHSGFNVYVGDPIEPDNRQLLEHIARYLLRAPVSLERLWYNPEAGTVTVRSLAGEGNTPVRFFSCFRAGDSPLMERIGAAAGLHRGAGGC